MYMEKQSQEKVLGQREMSLEKRYGNTFVNDVFKDNILLTIHYMAGNVTKSSDIDWHEVEKPFRYEFTLEPGKTFAFHDDVMEQFKPVITKTTNAHYNAQEGFKTDGYLYGDGVCHLASLINWAAKDAGLDVLAPVNHDFANIPEVPREYGTAIYAQPGESGVDKQQNLYITNTNDKPVTIVFDYKANTLKVSISEDA